MHTGDYLKNTRDGYIYLWTDALAQRADMVEPTEQELAVFLGLPLKKPRVIRQKAAIDTSTEALQIQVGAEPEMQTSLDLGAGHEA